ncbi:hypothetical protein [Streptomyces sp. MBT33]|uniref:hypothetical protein n=1 Tax=Streptomyces sp. MBT33 TaxID=1488363 RepID=UPI00190B46FE|nr:hypothetical protein [Streptomyces sp. MBT33]MBK3644309.1 hypothetical protein [Streptomyces sp. MBT33]
MGTGSTDSGSARRPRAGAAAAWAARTRLRRRASAEAWRSPAEQRLLLRWLEAAAAPGIRWPVVLGLPCGVGERLVFG